MTFEQWLQSRLTAHGFRVPQDGDWGRTSIVALRDFQKRMGIHQSGLADTVTVNALRQDPPDGPRDTRPAPAESMPPWMAEMNRRMGLHEVRDNAALTTFLKIGRFLGNPANLPWCGDAVESCIAKVLPDEVLPSNPFWAQAWAKFGRDVGDPIVGSIGVIRWSPKAGHVGFVAGVEGSKVVLLGGNQTNAITLASFPRDKFTAFRWPSTFAVKQYPPMRGKAALISTQGATR